MERNELLSAAALRIKSLQEGLRMYSKVMRSRDIIRVTGCNRAMDIRDRELIIAKKQLERVVEGYEVETLQWQEELERLRNQNQPPQDSTSQVQKLEAEVKSLKAKMQILQDKLLLEKFTYRALTAKIKSLECRLEGKEEPKKLTPEMKLYQLIEEVRDVTEIYGEDSKECKIKQKQLNKRLETMAEDAKREALAEHAKYKAKRRAALLTDKDAP